MHACMYDVIYIYIYIYIIWLRPSIDASKLLTLTLAEATGDRVSQGAASWEWWSSRIFARTAADMTFALGLGFRV